MRRSRPIALDVLKTLPARHEKPARQIRRAFPIERHISDTLLTANAGQSLLLLKIYQGELGFSHVLVIFT
jgi:hypothetical protein